MNTNYFVHIIGIGHITNVTHILLSTLHFFMFFWIFLNMLVVGSY